MGDLEAKQDEFLMNSNQGMPILEFGSDAQAIIEYAATSFVEIAADSTGTAEIDDSIQAQIQGEKIMDRPFKQEEEDRKQISGHTQKPRRALRFFFRHIVSFT